eukprot:CAMPEP_0119372186 /NCGR_PEP_ID=MMETSP1334-20130426/18199_1 /TAXON_ID=127549 /ORGANISM="Calcidiscus leptoporus, Strain RCC1130" /LENGTH=46 /DNA_ID= /DNA_START= /DNA_END= /DNA_ORIENTATION=
MHHGIEAQSLRDGFVRVARDEAVRSAIRRSHEVHNQRVPVQRALHL